jgi:hypothetical protein
MPNGWCVVPQKATLAELVNQSEAVVIVKDVRRLPLETGDGDYYFRITASAVTVLKGDLPEGGPLTIRIDQTVPERNPACCEEDTSYLMFLGRNEHRELAPIHVVNSVVRLGKLH